MLLTKFKFELNMGDLTRQFVPLNLSYFKSIANQLKFYMNHTLCYLTKYLFMLQLKQALTMAHIKVHLIFYISPLHSSLQNANIHDLE